jgi:hypothetical protein
MGAQIYFQWRCNASWLYRFILDGRYSGPKSTPGYCFSLGSVMISWSSRKQGSIAQSTAEAEHIVASVASSRKAVWLRKLLSNLFSTELEPTVIHYDNQRFIKLSENHV